MSTSIVRAEIARFLKSAEPEVLCISGRWGVGKTYAWQKFLLEAVNAGKFELDRYAYVSLFGISSLADLRFALVENTVSPSSVNRGPDAWSLKDILRKGEQTLAGRVLINSLSGFLRFKDAGDALYRAAFLTIKSQLICFDDLERKGAGLGMRDILGLTSMLREQRDCKIVLLFNKDAIPEGEQAELNEQLEKVVDTFLNFEPTSVEAAAIAIEGDDAVAKHLRARIGALGVSNIRVIKKIERWARRLAGILGSYDFSILEQAISTVVLAGWSFLQERDAPPIKFLRGYNAIMSGMTEGEWTDLIAQWHDPLNRYGYAVTDEFDLEIMDAICRGYFDGHRLRHFADKMQARLRYREKAQAFSKAWDLYHGDLTAEDDVVLDTIHSASLENMEAISPPTLNGTVQILRMYGRDAQASEIIARFIELMHADPESLNEDHDLFLHRPVDPQLYDAIEEARSQVEDDRDPAEMLKTMAQNRGFNPDRDSRRLGQLTTEDWVDLFDKIKGRELQGAMRWADIVANQAGAGEMRLRLTAAFERIANRSPMRRIKLQEWGHVPKDEEIPENAH